MEELGQSQNLWRNTVDWQGSSSLVVESMVEDVGRPGLDGLVESTAEDGGRPGLGAPQAQRSGNRSSNFSSRQALSSRFAKATPDQAAFCGPAFLSVIIGNPFDIAKTRLQAQAAGVSYSHPLSNIVSRMAHSGPKMMFADLKCSPSCSRAAIRGTTSICPPDCFQYKGTLDVFYKIIRQEGIGRLWRGTNAGLALAGLRVGIYMPCHYIFQNLFGYLTRYDVPLYLPYVAASLASSLACVTCYPIALARTRMQAFRETQTGVKSPGLWKTLLGVVPHVNGTRVQNNLQGYRVLWTGMGAQLARDVPFSVIWWSTIYPIRRKFWVAYDADALTILRASFSAGFIAGSLAAAATCPLDVAKTRRQIEKDPVRQLKMTTRQMLMEIWRGEGLKGLFTGVGPRIVRGGTSVGLVVSFFELVSYARRKRRNIARGRA